MFTDLVVAAPITHVAQVGADAPAHAQTKAAELTAMLERADAGPAGWRYDAHALFFDFYTPFRRNRALELLPPSYPAGNDTIFVQTAPVPEASAGAVAPLVDCVARGEALLRAADVAARTDCGPYGICCPTCGGPQTGRCRCFMADSWCAKGHHWHYSKSECFGPNRKPYDQRSIHAGPANHGHGPCCANPRVLYAPTSMGDTPAAVGQIVGTGQETPWTCGPAALRAVLAHYGRDVTEPEVSRAASNVPAIGARPEGMVRAAEVYGCHAKAFIMNSVGELVELLARRIPPIVIVDSWTRPGKVGHYVVVSKIDLTRGLVTVMDPHTEGNWRVMTAKEFDERWWAKRRGKDGQPVVIRRVCVVVTPGKGMAVVGASPVSPPVDVGGPTYDPERLQRTIDALIDRLKLNDAEPYGVRVDGQHLIFSYFTLLRKQRADELLSGSYKVGAQIIYVRNMVVDPSADVGGDPIWPALQQVIDKYARKMVQSGVPSVEVEFNWRTVTFLFDDVTAESVVKAGDLLPEREDVGGKTIYFTTRTIGRDANVGADAAVGKVDIVPDPKTGRTTRYDTSIPWWGKVLHYAANLGASVFMGPAGWKLADKTIGAIQDGTAGMDGRALKKWFNEAPNVEVMVWGIAHAKEFVDRAWKKTDGDWPARKAALLNLEVTPAMFSENRGEQIAAALKVMLLAAFTGGIDWPATRHVTEAILLMVYPGGIAPLVPIIESRGHDKKKRPDKKTWATTAGPYVAETIKMFERAAVAK